MPSTNDGAVERIRQQVSTPDDRPAAMGVAPSEAAIGFETLPLSSNHVALLQERGVAPEAAQARGVYTAANFDQLEVLGFSRRQLSVPALVVPLYNPAGNRESVLIRPDSPRLRKDGKPVKYEMLAGAHPRLDVPPVVRDLVLKEDHALWITEGPLKADAAASHGLCCIDICGVWNFARREDILADWESIPLRGRQVFLGFDSDAWTNRQVHRALSRLYAFLLQRHADVALIHLPTANGAKVGLDDYLAAGGSVADLVRTATNELGARPLEVGEMAAGPYLMRRDGIFWKKRTADGVEEVRLTNFPARIVAEEELDDGSGELANRYVIEASVRGVHREVHVPAVQFGSMHWVAELGVHAILSAGVSVPDRMREAIQLFSENAECRHIYTHTGWREIEGSHVYLTAGGAIGPAGRVANIQVKLDPRMQGFALPDPPDEIALREVAQASLDLIDAADRSITVPLAGAAYRAPLGPVDVSLHLYGASGSGKTTLAALAQQHYGSALNAGHLPAGWQSTDNSLEEIAHQAKDVVCVVDDFVVSAEQGSRGAMQRRADRLFRAAGNRSGRGRMRADGSLVAARPPRGLIISTGEDRPAGQSLAARRIDVAVSPGEVNWNAITRCQQHANEGLYALAMSGYVRWLAGRWDTLLGRLPGMRDAWRAELTGDGQHRRTPWALADLALGWSTFLDFAVEVGALSPEEQASLWQTVWEELARIGERQASAQREDDPIQRFLELLSATLQGGQAHVTAMDGTAPQDMAAWGWDVNDHQRGDHIGWLEGDALYLSPETAHSVVCQLARSQDEPFPLRRQEVARRLGERGLLASRDVGRQRLTVRRSMHGKRREVLHLHASTLLPDTEPSQPSQPSPPSGEVGPDATTAGRWRGTVSGNGKAYGPIDPSHRSHDAAPDQGNEPGLGQLGRLGRSVVEEEPGGLACANASHNRYWRGLDGQLICELCHPKPARSQWAGQ